MNLFEIDAAIMAAFDAAVDQDTGEILDEAALEALNELNVARETKIENIGCWIKNLDAEAKALKEQKQSFADRQARAERKAESLRKYLTAALQGEKFSTDRVAISWRKSEQVVIEDEAQLCDLLQRSGRDDLLTFTAPKANKTAIKAAIKDGSIEEDLVHIETKQNIQIK